MARGICHAGRNRLTGRRGSQMSAPQGTATTSSSPQRTRPAAPPQAEPPKKRRRKLGGRNKLKPVHEENEEREKHGDTEEVEQGQVQVQGPKHEQELNAKALYDVSGGMSTHGRFAIANGTILAANVIAAGMDNNARASSSVPMQIMAPQNAQLQRANARLEQERDSAVQQSKVALELILGLYRELGKEIPESAIRLLSASQAINGNMPSTSEEVASS